MGERGKRVFRLLMDPVRDADVIKRIESERPYIGYIRRLVKRDMHDDRLDYAALKASELQAENAKLRQQLADVTESMGRVEERCAKLRELVSDMYRDFVNCDCELRLHGKTFMAETRYAHRMRELGMEVEYE